jgi:short-subunit dehydrogenase
MDDLHNTDPSGTNRSLSEGRVAVITGASSGIGRATAHEFARRSCKLVVAARNKKALDEVVKECHKLGGEAFPVVMDVTREEDVNKLAKAAMEKFNRVDTWVNNAAVTLFGRFEEVPTADIRQVIETNLFGYIYGARAAIPIFREQGSGTLINVSSVVAVTGQPFTGAYAATKAAEKALSESLSQELADEENIHVCTVLPAVIDTPLFQHGANYTGKEVIPPQPVHSPEMVAEVIVNISENPKKEVFAGSSGPLTYMAKAVTPPNLYDKMSNNKINKNHFRDKASEPSPGNLYQHAMDQVIGGWSAEMHENEPFNKRLKAGMMLAGLSLALVTIWGLAKSGGNGKPA